MCRSLFYAKDCEFLVRKKEAGQNTVCFRCKQEIDYDDELIFSNRMHTKVFHVHCKIKLQLKQKVRPKKNLIKVGPLDKYCK